MAGYGKDKTSPEAIAVTERQAAALNLRKARVSYAEIAKELGYAGPSGAWEAVDTALEKMVKEPAEAVRQLELSRLDDMEAAIWESVLSGDLDSINTSLKLMERRARLLGLERKDAPIKVKIPKISSVKDAVAVTAALIEQVAEGEISPEDAGRIAALVGVFAKTVDSVELSEKLAKFEEMAQESAERAKKG